MWDKRRKRLVERPYSITLQAKKIIFAEINPNLREISVKELENKRICLEGIPAYGAFHKLNILRKEK